jgi:hypothetical protein
VYSSSLTALPQTVTSMVMASLVMNVSGAAPFPGRYPNPVASMGTKHRATLRLYEATRVCEGPARRRGYPKVRAPGGKLTPQIFILSASGKTSNV